MLLTHCTDRTFQLTPQWSRQRDQFVLPLRKRSITCRNKTFTCNCSSDRKRQVVVVGGGAAGLTAAYFASKNGAQVQVAETRRSRLRRLGLFIYNDWSGRKPVCPEYLNLHRESCLCWWFERRMLQKQYRDGMTLHSDLASEKLLTNQLFF